MDELNIKHKPCPFCGCEHVNPMIFTGFHHHLAHIECENCKAKGSEIIAEGYSEAVSGAWDAWDRRNG